MKGELGKAERLMAMRRAEIDQLSALIEASQAELDQSKARLSSASAAGNVDAMISEQSHISALDKEITKLRRSKEHCDHRIEVLTQYLKGLRERLDRLCQQAASLAAEGEQVRLSRVLVQIEAITGEREPSSAMIN